mgnify:FL=1
MVKIINLKTNKVISKEPPPALKCNVCGCDYNERVGGISGVIKYSADVNILDIAFCSICTAGIVQMLMNNQRRIK